MCALTGLRVCPCGPAVRKGKFEGVAYATTDGPQLRWRQAPGPRLLTAVKPTRRETPYSAAFAADSLRYARRTPHGPLHFSVHFPRMHAEPVIEPAQAAAALMLDDPVEQAAFTSWSQGEGGARIAQSHLQLSGLYCVACAGLIENALQA